MEPGSIRLVIVARGLPICLLSVGLTVAGAAHAQSGDPFDVYRQYLRALEKADSLEPLLPYYTKELSSRLSTMPQEMQGNYVKMNRRVLTDLKVVKQEVGPAKARFEMTAKGPDGHETTGSAVLVKEDGAWKIDDSAWISNVAKEPGLG
jgi:hypothetical protein